MITTGDILRLSAKRFGAKTAISFGQEALSFSELNAQANCLANALLASGVQKGTNIAIMTRNRPEYAVAHFGAAKSGAVTVNLLVAYAPDEIQYVLDKTRAELIFVEDFCQDKLAQVIDNLPALKHVVIIGEPDGKHPIKGATSFSDFLKKGSAAEPNITVHDSDPLGMTFTGGTTGRPKGALASHRARVLGNFISVIEFGLRNNDVVAVVSPMFHIFSLYVWFQSAMMAGCTASILKRWDPEEFMAMTERDGVTCALMVPAQLRSIFDAENFDPERLKSIRLIITGGAPMTLELLRELREKMPWVDYIENYGQSETGPLCFLQPHEVEAKKGSVGRPAIGLEIEIVDDEGKPLPPGEIGEIVTRGEHLMIGYFENPEETSQFFRNDDGWGWTGDLGVMDEEGYITLVGRSKEMIISGGENIYPKEVEITLDQHDAVHEVACVGIPDEKWGEVLAAFIVCKPGKTATAGEIESFCTSKIARFKRPRVIEFVESLPMTPAGKVKKNELRDSYLTGLQSKKSA